MIALSLCRLVSQAYSRLPGVASETRVGEGKKEGGGAGGGLAVCDFSSCSFCVPRPPSGRSIWGCSQCRAGPAAASGWPRRWCWDGSDSGCRCGTPRPSPAPGRRPARPTAAAPGTWRGCGSGGESCRRGERTKNPERHDLMWHLNTTEMFFILYFKWHLSPSSVLCEEGQQNDCRTSDVTWKRVHVLNLSLTWPPLSVVMFPFNCFTPKWKFSHYLLPPSWWEESWVKFFSGCRSSNDQIWHFLRRLCYDNLTRWGILSWEFSLECLF